MKHVILPLNQDSFHNIIMLKKFALAGAVNIHFKIFKEEFIQHNVEHDFYHTFSRKCIKYVILNILKEFYLHITTFNSIIFVQNNQRLMKRLLSSKISTLVIWNHNMLTRCSYISLAKYRHIN